MFITLIYVCVVSSAVYGRTIVSADGPEQLLLQVQNIAGMLLESHDAARGVSSGTSNVNEAPGNIPGTTNVCDSMCPKWCLKVTGTIASYTGCHFFCGNICDKQPNSTNPFIGNGNYEVVPILFDFENYDMNKDKYISKTEFMWTERITTDETEEVFKFADVNNDGLMSREEFESGPLVFTVQMAAELSSMGKSGKDSSATKPIDTSVIVSV